MLILATSWLCDPGVPLPEPVSSLMASWDSCDSPLSLGQCRSPLLSRRPVPFQADLFEMGPSRPPRQGRTSQPKCSMTAPHQPGVNIRTFRGAQGVLSKHLAAQATGGTVG